MSQFRDLIARMAIDAEFARHTRAHPDQVARQYGLTAEETEQLRGLADASASAGPTALGVRLSKAGGGGMGLITSGIIADLHAADLHPQLQPSTPLDPGVLGDFHPVLPHPPGPWGPDADGDHIPDFLDSNDHSTDISGEQWADNDHNHQPDILDNPLGRALYHAGPDADGDGIPDAFDSNDSSTDTSHEALGDNDHDGIFNYLDPTPNGIHVLDPNIFGHIDLHGVFDPSPGDGGHLGDPPLPPETGTGDVDATPPAAPSGSEGGGSGPAPIIVVDGSQAGGPTGAPGGTAGQDAVAIPVPPPIKDEGLSGQDLLIGGAGVAGGAVAGGAAAVAASKLLGNKGAQEGTAA